MSDDQARELCPNGDHRMDSDNDYDAWCRKCGYHEHEGFCNMGHTTALFKMSELLSAYREALYSLTPGGSEFHNDPANCSAFIRRKFDSDLRAVKNFKRERDGLSAQLSAYREALVEVKSRLIAFRPERNEAPILDKFIGELLSKIDSALEVKK